MEENKTFKPTTEWMKEKYDEMNQMLFDGELQQCDLSIFTKGNGAEGRTLGFFMIKGQNIKVCTGTRKIFKNDYFNGNIYINKNNFYDLCKPLISLNGNYSGTENAFVATLVHEMCHYYTYMNGYAPKQGHGPEFRRIGECVSIKSNGLFTIQRLATAEEMKNFTLNDEMRQKKEKRKENKLSKLIAVIVYKKNGQVRLTTTTDKTLVDAITLNYKSNDINKIIVTKDPIFIERIFELGYNKNLRSWRYWDVTDKLFLNILDRNIMKTEYINPMVKENNYKTKKIIKEIIDNFISNKLNKEDVIEINPNMNLGLESPLEMQ